MQIKSMSVGNWAFLYPAGERAQIDAIFVEGNLAISIKSLKMCIHIYSAVLLLGIYLTNQSKYRCKYLCINTVNKELFLLMKPKNNLHIQSEAAG